MRLNIKCFDWQSRSVRIFLGCFGIALTIVLPLLPGCAGKRAKTLDSPAPELKLPGASPSGAATGSNPISLSERAGSFWVVKPDGSKSCGIRKGISPKEAAKDLESVGVPVLRQKLGHDGKVRMMVCGADTGNQIELLIDGKGLPLAGERGYRVKGEN